MKSLAKDTALYGLSSIIGKLLNFFLVPLYVVKTNGYEYGEITQLYAWVAFLQVFLTYGLETGFFRFAYKDENSDPKLVYGTCMSSITATTLTFMALIFIFITPVSDFLGFGDRKIYITLFTVIIGLDIFTALPFSYLRFEQRPLRFASIKLISIFTNIGLNLFFLVLCPKIYRGEGTLLSYIYNPQNSLVLYIIISNVISSLISFILLSPQIFGMGLRMNVKLLKEILKYSFPLLILGVAGIINQTGDKILFPILLDNPDQAMKELGIYGVNYKLAVIMIMFIQAFRFAYEPFVFGKYRNADNKRAYIMAMKYFVIFGLFIFLCVGLLIGFLPDIPFITRHVRVDFFSGLAVVPIIMMAEFFFGIFFNLSFWYKLTDKTVWGAYFSIAGCILTITLNVIFVPKYGYMACAWIAFTVYFLMMVTSYFTRKKYYPINYKIKNGAFYVVIAALLYFVGIYVPISNNIILLIFRIVLIAIYGSIVVYKDRSEERRVGKEC